MDTPFNGVSPFAIFTDAQTGKRMLVRRDLITFVVPNASMKDVYTVYFGAQGERYVYVAEDAMEIYREIHGN